MNAIPIIMIAIFFTLMLVIIRKQLGVKTFEGFATGNRSFGFIALTFSVLSTWYTGSMYTAWAGMTIAYGFIGLYVIAYASISLLTMYFVAPQTYLWGKKYGIKTQPELMGFRYQSNALRVLFSIWGILFTIPWLIIELVTQGIVFSYATEGMINQFWGMVIGITIVAVYVLLGGMKSVVTANVFQGFVMIIGGTGLMVYFMFEYFGGFTTGMDMIINEFPASLTFPGPGWDPATPYWTSIIILSGLGGFMWPWAYNKLFAGESIRSIKKSALLAPIIGMVFYTTFVIAGLFIRSYDQVLDDPQGAFLWIAQESGPLILGFLGVIIMANSVGTVSSIIQGLSTLISRDLAQVIRTNLSDEMGVKIARIAVIILSLMAILIGTGDLGLMVFLALFTYDGIIMFFPIVIMGLYWKRANKEGAIISLLAGTTLSLSLRFINPSFIGSLGWQPGVYGMILSFIIIIIAGFTKKPSNFVESLWTDLEKIKDRNIQTKQESKKIG